MWPRLSCMCIIVSSISILVVNMLKQNNGRTKKSMLRRHAENSLLPCPCQVGLGRAMSFLAVKKIMDDYCRRVNVKLEVKDVSVGSKDENADHTGTVWLIDFEDQRGRFGSKTEFLRAVKRCIAPLQGHVDGVSRTEIRTVVPVSQGKACQSGRQKSGKEKK